MSRVRIGENDIPPGEEALNNRVVVKKTDDRPKEEAPKVPYEPVSGMTQEQRRVLREHQMNG